MAANPNLPAPSQVVGCDLDGTLTDYPQQLGMVLRAVRQAGHKVHIVSGTGSKDPATQADCHAKLEQLNNLGLGDCWDTIAAVPKPHDENKAAYLKQVGASLLIDNNRGNAKASADVCPVLVPWQTREGH